MIEMKIRSVTVTLVFIPNIQDTSSAVHDDQPLICWSTLFLRSASYPHIDRFPACLPVKYVDMDNEKRYFRLVLLPHGYHLRRYYEKCTWDAILWPWT